MTDQTIINPKSIKANPILFTAAYLTAVVSLLALPIRHLIFPLHPGESLVQIYNLIQIMACMTIILLAYALYIRAYKTAITACCIGSIFCVSIIAILLDTSVKHSMMRETTKSYSHWLETKNNNHLLRIKSLSEEDLGFATALLFVSHAVNNEPFEAAKIIEEGVSRHSRYENSTLANEVLKLAGEGLFDINLLAPTTIAKLHRDKDSYWAKYEFFIPTFNSLGESIKYHLFFVDLGISTDASYL